MADHRTGLLIINADDLGLTPQDTDVILECAQAGTITSATALVWMRDSDRAAELARGTELPIGLHLNLIEPYTGLDVPARVAATQRRVVDRLRGGGLSPHLYHPGWATDFEQCIADQLSRFLELYGRPPTHVDGHRHMHLAPNALFARTLTPIARCRRPVNRFRQESTPRREQARQLLHLVVRTRFATTTWCYSLRPMDPSSGGPGIAATLARATNDSVEVVVHPTWPEELAVLRSAAWREALESHRLGSFRDLG
jgi:chitin disaccharide deacetylase